ncbi:MAG: hypothetical protein WBV45_10065 [Lutimonas sp.]
MQEKVLNIVRLKIDWSESVPVFRYVLGSAFIVAITSLLNYDLAYLTAVLGLGYIAPGAKPLTFKQGLGFLLIVASLSILAVMFASAFQSYALVYMPLLLLTLMWLYYTDKIPMMVKLFALISMVLIPFLSIDSTAIGAFLARILVLNAFMAIILTQLVFMIFPLCEADEKFLKEKAEAPKQSSQQRYLYAVKILCILSPVIILFYLFQWSSSVLILTFVTILTVSPAFANPKTGLVMIVANILGGVFGIFAYQLLVMVPNFTFMILITLLVGFVFGQKLFSESKYAGIFGSAFSTFLLILGSVTASEDEAGSKVWDRVIQIGMAVIYVVVAFGLLDRFSKSKPNPAS